MLGLIDGEVNVGRRGLVTHLLLAPLTGECLGRRPGEARPRPAGESPAVTLQPRGLVEAQHNDDLFGKHRCLDLAPQPAVETERLVLRKPALADAQLIESGSGLLLGGR